MMADDATRGIVRKARRILWRLIQATSLLLCLAAVVLWIRGHWVEDFWQYQRLGLPSDPAGFVQYGLRSESGVFSFEHDVVARSPEEKSMGGIEPAEPGFHHGAWRDNVGQNFADPDMHWHGIPIGYFSMHPGSMVESFGAISGARAEDTYKTSTALWTPDWLVLGLLAVPLLVGMIRWRISQRRQRLRGFAVMAKARTDQKTE
jgi:hypothetical protein